MPRPRRADDVLEAAASRFFRDGITATGVDTVIADAGVAKMTLYSNFGSKDGLIVAYLEARERRSISMFDDLVARASSPIERALAPVHLYRTYLAEDGFHGCAFINAGAELPSDHPGRDVIRRHKQWLYDRWAALIEETGADDPAALVEECLLVLEGAFVHAGIGLGADRLDVAERVIRRRLQDAIPVAAGPAETER